MALSNFCNEYLLSSIFILLLFLNPFLCFSYEDYYHHHELSAPAQIPKLPLTSPLGFLKAMIGARKGSTIKGISDLKKYLSKLGYMKTNNSLENQANSDLFNDKLESALKKYQSFFSLQTTGILDAQIVVQLQLPRCGVPDFGMLKGSARSRKMGHGPKMRSLYNFFPGEPKWPPTSRNLTYSFSPGTREDVFRPIRYALDEWGKVSHFTFQYISNYDQADIKISFEVGDHGDGAPFEGPNGTLAHAFAPTDGRLHYDGSETWGDGVSPDFYDLQTIGMHELGHVLGLDHSQFSAAIMYPYFAPGTRRGLQYDDILGIQTLYGIKANNSFSS